MKTGHYTYRISWSPEDNEFVATCCEFPSLSWLDASEEAAFRGIRKLVRDVASDMLANGETPPQPLAERAYSGKFQLRLPPDMHRRLTIEAAEAGVSINRWVNFKLAG